MRILAFDTTGAQCAAALVVDGQVVAQDVRQARHGHAAMLAPMLREIFVQSGVVAATLDRLVVTRGPGGFTGIRVGLATAAGLARASGAAVHGLTTFQAVMLALPEAAVASGGPVVVALDSRREPVFVQVFDRRAAVSGAPHSLGAAAIGSLLPADCGPVLVVGDAAARAAAAMRAAGIKVADVCPVAPDPSAMAMHILANPHEPGPATPLYVAPPAVGGPDAAQAVQSMQP